MKGGSECRCLPDGNTFEFRVSGWGFRIESRLNPNQSPQSEIRKIIMFWILVGLNVLWAGAYPSAKVLMGQISPEWAVAWRFGGGALGLSMLIAIPPLRRRLASKFPKGWRDMLWAMALGLIGIPSIFLPYFHGTRLTTATEATILVSIVPVYCALLAWWWLKEPFPPKKWVGVLLALTGAWVIVNKGFALQEFSGSSLGKLLILLGGLAEGITAVVAKPLVMRYSGLAILWIEMCCAGLMLTLIALLSSGVPQQVEPTAAFQSALLYLILICTVFNFVVWFYVMERVPIGAMSISIFAQTPAAAFIGYFLLDERLHPAVWAGTVVILMGVWLTIRAQPVPSRVSAIN